KNVNLFVAFNNVTSENGEGYVDYLWPKPTKTGLTERQPKLSFVKLFKPWNWIIGTGLYMDDIEKDVQKRLNAVKNELKESLNKIKITKSGYMFIFNPEYEIIVHPLQNELNIAELKNPDTGNKILDDLMDAASTKDGEILYPWSKPGDINNFIYKKAAYVKHFEPLDWYIGLSFYIDEVEASAKGLREEVMYLSSIFLVIALLAGIFLAHKLAHPLKEITAAFGKGAGGNYSIRLKIKSQDEIGRLTRYYNNFMEEIENSHTQLKISENRFRTLFEKSADARIILNENRIANCNEAAVKMLKLSSKNELLNKTPGEISPEFQPGGKNSVVEAAKMIKLAFEKGIHSFEWNHIRANGEVFPAAIEMTLIEYGGKKRLHVLWRDISEKKKTEQQLLQTQKMETVGTLAGGLAHDFNNVLSGIIGTVSLIENILASKRELKPDKLANYIAIIKKSGERAADLVQQLLSISKKQELFFVPVDLNRIIKDVMKVAENSFDKSIEFEPHYSKKLTMVNADPSQLEQVLLNLCINSSHSMTIMRGKDEKWGGVLEIQVSSIKADHHFIKTHPDAENIDYWVLSIKDTGIGIKKEYLPKIFTPFFSTKDKGKGTGLGLSMVYSIIKQHRGFIDVYSEENTGSTFNVFLPVLLKNSQHVDIEIMEEKIPKGEGLILIIDDEDILRETANSILNELGYDVLIADNGIKGIEIFKENHKKINAVLLDMIMPKLSGKETYIELKKIKNDVKVLLASGFKQDERVQETIQLGVNGFIQKPYTLRKIAFAIKNVLDTK
ncbi:MAG: cache domain-containing protein, partial [Calditrichia bacterium]|nr:cache domain-containing protein [Calditrichia bacterium]